jgi:nucleotide-binding universal stress UspA family protein
MEKREIRKILVPVDGSNPSFDAASLAIEVAKRFGAQLQVLHVVKIDQSLRALGLIGTSYSNFVEKSMEGARKEADAWFERIHKEGEALGVAVNANVVDTSISVVGEITNYAEKNEIDLIVMGTKGLSGFTKLLMGSVATGVVQYAPCPVLTVR